MCFNMFVRGMLCVLYNHSLHVLLHCVCFAVATVLGSFKPVSLNAMVMSGIDIKNSVSRI